jgi:hypothetical protein
MDDAFAADRGVVSSLYTLRRAGGLKLPRHEPPPGFQTHAHGSDVRCGSYGAEGGLWGLKRAAFLALMADWVDSWAIYTYLVLVCSQNFSEHQHKYNSSCNDIEYLENPFISAATMASLTSYS